MDRLKLGNKVGTLGRNHSWKGGCLLSETSGMGGLVEGHVTDRWVGGWIKHISLFGVQAEASSLQAVLGVRGLACAGVRPALLCLRALSLSSTATLS